jgi:hypothetical protein
MNELLQHAKHTNKLMTLPKKKREVRRIIKVYTLFSYVDICTCFLNMIDVPSPALAVFEITSTGLKFLFSRVGDKADAAIALGSNLDLTPRILTENVLNFPRSLQANSGIGPRLGPI